MCWNSHDNRYDLVTQFQTHQQILKVPLRKSWKTIFKQTKNNFLRNDEHLLSNISLIFGILCGSMRWKREATTL